MKKRLTEKINDTVVIPLRNSICGLDMPQWKLTHVNDNETYLSGEAANRLAEYESLGIEPNVAVELNKTAESIGKDISEIYDLQELSRFIRNNFSDMAEGIRHIKKLLDEELK